MATPKPCFTRALPECSTEPARSGAVRTTEPWWLALDEAIGHDPAAYCAGFDEDEDEDPNPPQFYK